MAYDFDRVIERRHTESSKWRKYGADVVPLWVADMDFASPEPVIRALRERVEHGVFGYGYNQERSPLHDLFADRSEEHTSELQSHSDLVCRLLLEKKNNLTDSYANFLIIYVDIGII